MAEAEIEKLNHTIKLIQKLRAGVTKVFSDLSCGIVPSSTPDAETNVVEDLHKSLISINENVSDIEKIVPNLNSINVQAHPNTGLLNLDPVIDKSPIYSQVLQAHKWTNKVHKLSDFAFPILNQGQLKRTDHGGTPFNTSAKRIRKLTPTAHAVPPQNVDNVINQVSPIMERHCPETTLKILRPMGNNSAVLQLTLGKVCKAQIILRGLLLEAAIVKAYGEDFLTDDGKIDLWSKSRFKVFNEVTDIVTMATLHFVQPQFPEVGLRSFLIWFTNFKNLFSAPCSKCGKYLQNGLPPVWRDVRAPVPIHDGCRNL